MNEGRGALPALSMDHIDIRGPMKFRILRAACRIAPIRVMHPFR